MAETFAGEHHEHRHGHPDCGHNHAIARRLDRAKEDAKSAAHRSRVRRALAIGVIGMARFAVSSFCPLDDILPLAIQVINPTAVTHNQDQLGIMPRGQDPVESGTAKLRRHLYSYPHNGPEPPSLSPFAEFSAPSVSWPEDALVKDGRLTLVAGRTSLGNQYISPTEFILS